MHQPPAVHCLGCDYDLLGVAKGVCPECGAGFNPADPATFGPRGGGRVRRWERRLRRPAIIAAVLPAPVATGFGIEYLLAWLMLGREPHPSADMGPPLVVVHFIVGWSLILSPVLTGLLMIAWAWFVIEGIPGNRRWSLVLLLAVGSWVLATAIWALYPPKVNRWWFD